MRDHSSLALHAVDDEEGTKMKRRRSEDGVKMKRRWSEEGIKKRG
jgi:hypothetical protein